MPGHTKSTAHPKERALFPFLFAVTVFGIIAPNQGGIHPLAELDSFAKDSRQKIPVLFGITTQTINLTKII